MVETLVPQVCPECQGGQLYRDGLRMLSDGNQVQRWLCRKCGYRFSDESAKNNKIKYKVETEGKNAQVCEFLTEGSKNLDAATETKLVAGKVEKNVKGKLVEFAWHLKREGNAESTIRTYTSLLRKLEGLNASLLNPDSVKDVLAKNDMKQNTKATIIAVYTSFLKFLGRSWNPPKCSYQHKIPFIPLESEIDDLIAGCTKPLSASLQSLKETGMRIGECLHLRWIDVNTETNTIILNDTEKNGKPRVFNVSPKLIGMLQGLPKASEYVFGSSSISTKQASFRRQKRRLAQKLSNPRLDRITYHTFRHWKGTMEYHKTHDIEHVQRLLGHRDIENTMIYINMESLVFQSKNDEFHVKIAETLDEACKLLEVGFEYVTDMDGKKLFRKRK